MDTMEFSGMSDKSAHLALIHTDLIDCRRHNKAIIAVGDPSDWANKGAELSDYDDMIFISFQEINEGYLDYYRPSLIVSPALSPAFDCIELAMLLRNIGYRGAYRAIVRDLPNPDLVEREVKSFCPLLDFGVLKVES